MKRSRLRWMAILAAGVVLLLSGSAFAVLGDFAQPSTSPETVGDRPVWVAAGNLNGDANVDLAVTNLDDDTVSVLLGNGSGNFDEPMGSPVAAGDVPVGVAIADLDGTNGNDLAVANGIIGPGNGTVTTLLNDGTGTFAVGSTEAADNAPAAISAAQLDSNNAPDLVVTNNLSMPTTANVTVLLNDNDGSGDLTPGTTVGSGGINPRNIVTEDFNGDAETDLAIPNNHNGMAGGVGILLGNGSGGFAAATVEAVGNGPNSVAAGRLDGDADLDLAVPNSNQNTISILLGDGMGDFSEKPMTSPEMAGVGTNPIGVVAANLNGDSFTDLAVANYDTDNVSILINDGAGDFAPAGTSPEGAGDQARELVAANLNGDTALDLAVANDLTAGSVSILLNQLDPVVPPPAATTPAATPTTTVTAKKRCKKRKKRAAASKRCKRKKRK